MKSLTDKIDDLVSRSLDFHSARQKLIAGNIANIDTPFYKPRDLNFKKTLQIESDKIFNNSKIKTLELAQTKGKSFKSITDEDDTKPSVFYRGGHLAKNDGNSVDLDIETTEMTKNTMMFQAIISGMKAKGKIMKSVIDASKQTS